MDAAAASKVDHSQGVEDPWGLPEPMGGDAVDHGVDQGEQAVRVEVAPAAGKAMEGLINHIS